MKRLLLLLALPLLFASAKGNAQNENNDNKVKPNYELAERFSPKKVGRMVKQTRVQPVWFELTIYLTPHP